MWLLSINIVHLHACQWLSAVMRVKSGLLSLLKTTFNPNSLDSVLRSQFCLWGFVQAFWDVWAEIWMTKGSQCEFLLRMIVLPALWHHSVLGCHSPFSTLRPTHLKWLSPHHPAYFISCSFFFIAFFAI